MPARTLKRPQDRPFPRRNGLFPFPSLSRSTLPPGRIPCNPEGADMIRTAPSCSFPGLCSFLFPFYPPKLGKAFVDRPNWVAGSSLFPFPVLPGLLRRPRFPPAVIIPSKSLPVLTATRIAEPMLVIPPLFLFSIRTFFRLKLSF